MKPSAWKIFWLFVKIGALLLGGGYVILPMLISEMVEKRSWIEQEELVEYYSISQCLPGIIAVNTAIFTGYKLRGKLGALAAVIGMCFAPFWSIILLACVLEVLVNMGIVKNIFWGVGIGIIVMILLTIKEIWSKSIVDKFSFALFIGIFLVCVSSKISPVLVVLGAAVCGIAYKLIERRRSDR